MSAEALRGFENVEDLLELYLLDYTVLITKTDDLLQLLQNAEDMVSMRLDTSQNELLVVNTVVILLGACISFGSYMAGLFGQNLDNVTFLQPKTGSFALITICIVALCVLTFTLSVAYYNRNGLLPRKVRIKTHAPLDAPAVEKKEQ